MAKFLQESKLNEIRGKVLVMKATRDELLAVFGHLDALELRLDAADEDDALGTEGWRHWMGLPNA